jgi:Sporulation and spore germination
MKKLIALLVSTLLIAGCATTTAPISDNTDNTDNIETSPISVTIEQVMAYKIFYIAPEDNGASGKKIGCDDSIVAVEGTPTTTDTKSLSSTGYRMNTAYQELLTNKDLEYGESGLQNTLASSNLIVENITINKDTAEVKLSGELITGGTCDSPRVEAQLTEIALQFADITTVSILINEEPLESVLSLKGE